MDRIYELSLIVPAYKPGSKIIDDIKSKKTVLDELGINYELIYVFEGFIHTTQKDFFEIANKFAEENSTKEKQIRVIGYQPNKGKGFGVRYGFSHSKGSHIGFIDFLNDIDPKYIKTFYSEIATGNYDLVIANKFHNSASFYDASKVGLHMKTTSQMFLLAVRILTGLELPDTQTGIKFFDGDKIRKLIPLLGVSSFSFDVEIMVAMFRNGFDRLKIVPINVSVGGSTEGKKGKTTVNKKRIFFALLDILRISFNSRVRKKYTKLV